jgi:hypothetical protein
MHMHDLVDVQSIIADIMLGGFIKLISPPPITEEAELSQPFRNVAILDEIP